MVTMMTERKQFLLETIIKEHIKTAQPVSSGMLVTKYKLGISPATVRNEMIELEDDGLIYQPHTSAGRLPTAAAYRLFSQEILKNKKIKNLKESEESLLNQLFFKDEVNLRKTARAISELAGASVFWAFHKNDLYYTGLSQLFTQPEFKQTSAICDVSNIIDRMEEIIDDIFEEISLGEQVLVGEDNPFGNFLSTILVKYKNQDAHGLFGILGPMRMDYHRNLALARFIREKFE